jgi:hypothetical protein
MAEWSMAVVLKTSRIGYTKTIMVSQPNSTHDVPNMARFYAILPFLELEAITDHPNRRRKTR